MCKYCEDDGSRTNLGILGFADCLTQLEFSVDDDGQGSIDVSWCAYDEGSGYTDDWVKVWVNYCPWCGRKLKQGETVKPPAQPCVGGFFLLYCNCARGEADEPIKPVLVNESTNLSCFITL